jgi:hypothetical protein
MNLLVSAVLGAALLVAEGVPPKGMVPVEVGMLGALSETPWGLEIDARGYLTTWAVDSAKATRKLSGVERAEVSRLLSALPTGRTKYEYGQYLVDASTAFRLRVGASSALREYSISSSLGPDADRAQVRKILEALTYLRSLVPSMTAVWPPKAGAGRSGRRRTRG